MAGFVAGTPTALTLLTNTAAAGADTEIVEFDINNAAFGEIQVAITTNASASAGCDVKLVRVVNGVASTNIYQPLSVGPNETAKLNFVLQAGTYKLIVTNNDATYDATVNGVTIVTYTWG